MKFIVTNILICFGIATVCAQSQWSVQPDNNNLRIRNSSLSNYFQFSEVPGVMANFTTNHRRMRFGVLEENAIFPIEFGSSDILFRTSNELRMAILGSKIGINTNSPEVGFHIHKKMFKLTGVDGDYAGYGGPTVLFARNTGNNGNYAITYNVNVNGLNFWKPWPAIEGGVSESPVMFLSDLGRVGVKTYNPTADFTVHGNVLIGNPDEVTLPNPQLFSLYVQKGILAQRLKIAIPNSADWSDYVFLPSYRLRPLHEVRDFISENGHLPEVPSANQLADEGGYDVLQMDATLLKKIEELTLYLLQLSEENEELKNRIELLEEKK